MKQSLFVLALVQAGLAVLCILGITVNCLAQEPALENADHAGIISRWDDQTLERGHKLFLLACAPCHGTDGIHTVNPQSRPFAVDRFQNGSDPLSMFKTISHGFKNMPSQTWMTPEQRYDVIDYIRETFVKRLNPTQFTEVTQTYLDSLPKFDPTLPSAGDQQAERDFGPVLESQLGTNFPDVLTFRLSDDVTLSYDLHRLQTAGLWQGGYLDLSRTHHYLQRGEGQPIPRGATLKGLQHWSWTAAQLTSAGMNLSARGPMPPDQMKYLGHYVYNRQAALAFTIAGRTVLEWPQAIRSNDWIVLSHNLRIAPGTSPLRLCVGQADGPPGTLSGVVAFGWESTPQRSGLASNHLAVVSAADGSSGQGSVDNQILTAAAVLGSTDGLQWEVDDQHRLMLQIPPASEPLLVRVLRSTVNDTAGLRRFEALARQLQSEPVPDPETLTHGGARLWPMPIEVQGTLGHEAGAYVLDTIPVPFDNPYHAWLRTSALDFFPDGRAVVTTYGGDVWIVSGLNESLDKVEWSRLASGLFEPFGVRVIDGLIYVTCRNGIVRLHDLNGDGEADFYETFYADQDVSTFFHAFNFDLHRDKDGNLYYVKPGQYTDYSLPGAVIQVSPDGRSSQVFCTGFRVPNGMGLLPDGRLTVSDNQGNWMPASKINIVRRGGFYGYVQNLDGGGAYGDYWAPDGGRIRPRTVTIPPTFDQPIIWMPQEFDNSSGGQLWVDDKRFGPLSGRLLHTSFGKGWMYYLMLQEVGSQSQAAIVALPFQFDAGIMRARVNPADGQVYATGLSGWQGPPGGKDGCLQRLRYTGKPIKLLDDVKVSRGALDLHFNFSLDPVSATDSTSFHLEQWNYLWTAAYGSDQYSAEHPGEKGHDLLAISSIQLANDKRSVHLQIPALRRVQQVEIRVKVRAMDGTPFSELAYLTINAIPE